MRPLPDSLREALAGDGRGLSVLVVRLGALGDILRTLPPVRLLRFAVPDARLDWVCDDRWSTFLSKHPDIDSVIAVPRTELDAAARNPFRLARAAARLWDLRRDLRRPAYDLVLDFHGNLRSGAVGAMSGSAVRLGYAAPQAREGNRLLTSHRIEPLPRRSTRMERNLALVRSLGLPSEPLPDAGLCVDPYAAAAAAELVETLWGAATPYAVINPGASAEQSYKKPPTRLLAEAAGALGKHGLGTVVVWGPGEEADAEATVRHSAGRARLAPRTSLTVLTALLKRAVFLVSGDSGPLHLACAVGCPVVAIYGPTDPQINSPWGVPFQSVASPGHVYTGIKRRDRVGGRFDGIPDGATAEAVDSLLARPEVRRRLVADAS